MELQKVSERDRQFGFVLELHLHLDLKLSPALLADFKWEVVNHYFKRKHRIHLVGSDGTWNEA